MTNSRPKAKTPSVWRRRKCLNCQKQFSTLELPNYTTALSVTNANSKRSQPFSRDKLFLSLHKSLSHRQDAQGSATALTTTIIGRLLNKNNNETGVIATKQIAQLNQETLKRFDPLAATTYKAYHQTALKSSR